MGGLTSADLAYMRDTVGELLPDACTILSEALSADGQGGQTSTWGTIAINVPCRFDESGQTGGNQLVPAGGALREAHRYMLSLPQNTPIGAHDRVELGGATYNVVSVDVGVSWEVVTRAVLELI
jgi:hypothetical protein